MCVMTDPVKSGCTHTRGFVRFFVRMRGSVSIAVGFIRNKAQWVFVQQCQRMA
jgi:hypothetical protein